MALPDIGEGRMLAGHDNFVLSSANTEIRLKVTLVYFVQMTMFSGSVW